VKRRPNQQSPVSLRPAKTTSEGWSLQRLVIPAARLVHHLADRSQRHDNFDRHFSLLMLEECRGMEDSLGVVSATRKESAAQLRPRDRKICSAQGLQGEIIALEVTRSRSDRAMLVNSSQEEGEPGVCGCERKS
jgi:hypothetical protein